jgi:hypothetical protein
VKKREEPEAARAWDQCATSAVTMPRKFRDPREPRATSPLCQPCHFSLVCSLQIAPPRSSRVSQVSSAASCFICHLTRPILTTLYYLSVQQFFSVISVSLIDAVETVSTNLHTQHVYLCPTTSHARLQGKTVTNSIQTNTTDCGVSACRRIHLLAFLPLPSPTML